MIKIVKDNQKRDYELTYLLPAYFTSAELNKHKAVVEELVKKHKGEIKNTEDWGKKTLAYRIKKAGKSHSEAVYIHLVLTFLPEKVQKFAREVQLLDDLLRHLLVVSV